VIDNKNKGDKDEIQDIVSCARHSGRFLFKQPIPWLQQKQVVTRKNKIEIPQSPAPGLEKNDSTPVRSLKGLVSLRTETKPNSKMPENDFVDPQLLADTFPGNLALPPNNG
jgi:hypothetical protein